MDQPRPLVVTSDRTRVDNSSRICKDFTPGLKFSPFYFLR